MDATPLMYTVAEFRRLARIASLRFGGFSNGARLQR